MSKCERRVRCGLRIVLHLAVWKVLVNLLSGDPMELQRCKPELDWSQENMGKKEVWTEVIDIFLEGIFL